MSSLKLLCSVLLAAILLLQGAARPAHAAWPGRSVASRSASTSTSRPRAILQATKRGLAAARVVAGLGAPAWVPALAVALGRHWNGNMTHYDGPALVYGTVIGACVFALTVLGSRKAAR